MTKKIHILFVDDDEIVRRIFGAKLALAGFEVIYAEDGSLGREMARRFQPELIIMDLAMPVVDGIRSANMLKKEKITSKIPIILFTNSDLSIEAEKWAKDLGITEYISKATTPDKFIELIKKVLVKYKIKIPRAKTD
jgi:CheY-like chemotaxis protein